MTKNKSNHKKKNKKGGGSSPKTDETTPVLPTPPASDGASSTSVPNHTKQKHGGKTNKAKEPTVHPADASEWASARRTTAPSATMGSDRAPPRAPPRAAPRAPPPRTHPGAGAGRAGRAGAHCGCDVLDSLIVYAILSGALFADDDDDDDYRYAGYGAEEQVGRMPMPGGAGGGAFIEAIDSGDELA